MSLGFKLQGLGSFIPNWYVNIKYKTTEDKLELYKPLFLNFVLWYFCIYNNHRNMLQSFFFFLQMNHYLERTLHTVELQKEKLFDLQLIESLGKVFPDVSF